jgi:hypothetical protein
VDFTKVLKQLSEFLEEKQHPYAVIGGVGLAAYGMPRATCYLDLVLDANAQAAMIQFLESLGYETLHRSTGYSNHRHAEREMGSVDVVYVRDETSRRVFDASRVLEGPGGLRVPIPSPEHLIAMKVVAMKNDPSRTYQDMADIRFLLTLADVDRDEVRSQFEKHGLLERYRELEAS